MSVLGARWSCPPCPTWAADRIARELGTSPTLASILVRRGCATPASARRFLAADTRHDHWLMPGMERACEQILRHVELGSRVVVHGDYDVDGVCSTALLVEALRALGCDASWHLPERADGYGLSVATVRRLAAQETGLLVTVDCGVTSIAEVEAAGALGMDVIVTDHHLPGERLPSCPVVHPALEPYPFEGLCATGVVHKLSLALRERAGLDAAEALRELDLVALATVCDLVPLRDENRAFVREGLAALARTDRPGLRALMGVAALAPGDVDERAVGFRLGPRLNAAGRVRSADAALELLLTQDAERATEVADELDLLNRDRRDLETRILFSAEQQRAEQDGAPAYVLAGEGWHPGVVGIVASRMAERHHRPCFVVALEGEHGRGSGRSIPALDLHAALEACGGHLRRFGGHRAAAGFEIDRARLDAFREQLVHHVSATLTPDDLTPVEETDAIVPGTSLGITLAEELRRLAPFGHGNPEPTLLVPGARLVDTRPMGQEAQHARFRLVSAGVRAEGVAFRTTAAALRKGAGDSCDAAVRLELDEWNGRVAARVVLTAACAPEPGRCVVGGPARDFWSVVERELDAEHEGGGATPLVSVEARGAGRDVRDRRGQGIAGLAGELLATGEPVLAVCADVERRRAGLSSVAGLARSGDPARGEASEAPGYPRLRRGELAIASWDRLVAEPELAAPFTHLLAVDPPPGRSALAAAAQAPAEAEEGALCHLGWGAPEVDFALRVARAGLDLRGPLIEVYRRLRESGAGAGGALERVLVGSGSYPRPAEVGGRLLRVLAELGLIALERDTAGVSCRMLDAPRTALERSAAHRAYRGRLEEIERYLAEERRRIVGGEEPRAADPLAARPPAAVPDVARA